MIPQYTVYQCKSMKDDTPKGYIHLSDNCYVTCCGKNLDARWYVLYNNYSNGATCPKCLKNCETVPKPITSIDKIRMTIKEMNPNFTEEQIEAVMVEMFSNIEKLLNTESKGNS